MKKLCTILIASLSLMCSGFGLVYAQTPVCDEFDGSTINTSMWNLVNDDWTLSNGQITGHWDIGCAHCDQANLVLQNAVQPTGDYTFETDMVYEPGKYGHRVVLYNSAGNKYNIIYDVSQKNFIIEVKQEGANYVPVIPFITNLTYNNTSGAINRAKIVKSGNEYACYLNDQYLSTLIDTRWSGDLRRP